MSRKLLLASLITLMVTIFVTPITSAQSPFSNSKQEACKGANLGSSGSCDKKTNEKKVNDLIATIINILSVIVGIVAVIMIIINGFRFITSGGDSNAVSSARNGIIYAIVGLILVAFAQVIVRYVVLKL